VNWLKLSPQRAILLSILPIKLDITTFNYSLAEYRSKFFEIFEPISTSFCSFPDRLYFRTNVNRIMLKNNYISCRRFTCHARNSSFFSIVVFLYKSYSRCCVSWHVLWSEGTSSRSRNHDDRDVRLILMVISHWGCLRDAKFVVRVFKIAKKGHAIQERSGKERTTDFRSFESSASSFFPPL